MAKKTTAKKIRSKKLEDRIAPGMVGGGIVDPGMVDAVDSDLNQQDDQSMGESSETSSESYNEGPEGSEGQYLDEASSDNLNDYDDKGDAPYSEGDDYDSSSTEEYDEFSSGVSAEGTQDYGDWQEPDWVEAQADGSVHIEPPEGVTVNPDEGIASFPVEVANEELPLPDDVQITPEGGMNVGLPEGTQYLEESNSLLFQEGSIEVNDVPEEMNAVTNPDGSVMVSLPEDGMEYDAATNSVNVDNYWANELTPENVEINDNGSVDVQLPENGVEYNDDGSITLEAEGSQYMETPPPEYIENSDFAELNADGSVTIEPPEGVEVDGGIASVSNEVFNEQIPNDDFHVNDDGSASFQLPEGSEFDANTNALTLPEGEINLNEVPEGIDAHLNPDGTTSVTLPEGMDYNADAGTVEMNNYWANEVSPDSMQVSEDGSVQFALPEDTEYFEDGSFSIPSDQIDFVEQPLPDYVHDCECVTPEADGTYSVTPPTEFNVNPETGTMEIPYDAIDAHVPVDDGVTFNSDGTMNVQLPESFDYNADANSLTFPEGEVDVNEVPEQVNGTVNEDGSVTVFLQDGMNFDSSAGEINLDNYWTNELVPEPVTVNPDGSLMVQLPQDLDYGDDGSFSLEAHQADFLENPCPDYCSGGPDFVDVNADGSVTIESYNGIEVYPEDGHITMDTEFVHEHFDNYIPDEISFNGDGTMNMQMPEGTQFNADANSLTFPEGQAHMDEIPPEVQPVLNADGTISVTLQPGMEFDPEAGQVQFDQNWTNEFTPDAVDFNSDGSINVSMPHDCHFHDDGSIHLPEDSADFMSDPYPEYVDHGPDWVNDNPDGSVTIQPPESMSVDPNSGTVSMTIDAAMTEMGGDLIPEEVQLNADGTADIKIPENANYDAATNTLSIEAGGYELHDMPKDFPYEVDASGNLTVSLPEGVDYNADTHAIHISNELLNEMAPEPIDITADGQFVINLPEDTQYFDDGAFVISAESADFIDEPNEYQQEGATYQQAA